MKKKMKKAVSLLLTVVLVFSVFAIVPMTTVSAATYNCLFPVKGGRIAYGYGYSASYGAWHDGVDIHSGGNDTIYAAFDGVVGATANSCYHVSCGYACEHYSTYGNYIRINNDNGTKAYYGHLLRNSIKVSVGQRVKRGQAIATMGSSGYSTGKHLHFELREPDGKTKINTNPDAGVSNRNSYTGYDGDNPPPPPPVTYSATTGGSSNISNTNATISGSANASNGSAPHVSSWGYYIGTNSNPGDKKTAGWPNGNVSSLSCNVKDHCGNLSPGTTYYYKIWAVINGREYSGGVNSFRTTAVKPSASTIKTSTADIGLGVNPVVTWNGASYVDSYTVQLKNSNGDVVQSKAGITGTTYSFAGLNTAGTYTATVYSVNTAGSTQGNSVNITVHPNSTVRFIDVNPETNEEVVVKEQSVVYGQNATAPANPSKTGYTFKKWNGTIRKIQY